MQIKNDMIYQYHKQSGTKPNLVAKIWPPTLVAIYALLPKLVANATKIGSQR